MHAPHCTNRVRHVLSLLHPRKAYISRVQQLGLHLSRANDPRAERLLRPAWPNVQTGASMGFPLRWLSFGLLMPLCIVARVDARTDVLDRYVGSFAATGSILEGPGANSHRV